nr:hypothetical protein CFP56_16918 [Quercus suber]
MFIFPVSIFLISQRDRPLKPGPQNKKQRTLHFRFPTVRYASTHLLPQVRHGRFRLVQDVRQLWLGLPSLIQPLTSTSRSDGSKGCSADGGVTEQGG